MIDALFFCALSPYLLYGLRIKNQETSAATIKLLRSMYTLAEEVTYAPVARGMLKTMKDFERLFPKSLRQPVFHLLTHLARESLHNGCVRNTWCFPAESAYGRLAQRAENRAHIAVNIMASHFENMTTCALMSNKRVASSVQALGITAHTPKTPRDIFMRSSEGTLTGVGNVVEKGSSVFRQLKKGIKAFTQKYRLDSVVSHRTALTKNGRILRTKNRVTKLNAISSFVIYTPADEDNVVHKNIDHKRLHVFVGRILKFFRCGFKARDKERGGKRHRFVEDLVLLKVTRATKRISRPHEPFSLKVGAQTYEKYIGLQDLYLQPSLSADPATADAHAEHKRILIYGIH